MSPTQPPNAQDQTTMHAQTHHPPMTSSTQTLTQYDDVLRSIITKRGLRGADAEDALQEVYLRALKTSSTPHTLRPWLCTIAHNVCNDLYSKQQRTHTDTIDDTLTTQSPSPEDHAILHERTTRLHDAINTLPSSQRNLVHAAYLHEHPYNHIQSTHNLSKTALASRLHRAKRRLHSILTQPHNALPILATSPTRWAALALFTPIITFLLPGIGASLLLHKLHRTPRRTTLIAALITLLITATLSTITIASLYFSILPSLTGLLTILSAAPCFIAPTLLTLHLNATHPPKTTHTPTLLFAIALHTPLLATLLFEIIAFQNIRFSLFLLAISVLTPTLHLSGLSIASIFTTPRTHSTPKLIRALLYTATATAFSIHFAPHLTTALPWILTNTLLALFAHLLLAPFLPKPTTHQPT